DLAGPGNSIWSGDGEALGAADFHPCTGSIHEFQKRRVFGGRRSFGKIWAAEMINNQRDVQISEEIGKIGEIRRFEVHHDVPAKLTDLCCNQFDFFQWLVFDEAFHEIEPDAANTTIVHVFELALADVTADGDDAAGGISKVIKGIEQCCVVPAMTRSLNNNIS